MGRLARTVDMRNAYKDLIEKSEGKRTRERFRRGR